MKRFLCALLIAVMALMVSGCGFNKIKDERAHNDGRVTCLYNDGFCMIYRDNETGVQYVARANAGLTVLLNPDGTPYTGEWEGNKQ